jgi:hypothetical protein
VTCYRIYIGQDSITQDEEREVVQAADFLIKEARKLQQTSICRLDFLSLIKPRLYFIDEEKSRQLQPNRMER